MNHLPRIALRSMLVVVLFVTAAGDIGRNQAQRPRPAADGEPGPFPSDWFGMQRAFPGETLNHDAWLAAVEWARVEREAGLLTTQSATPRVWQEAGPYNIGGRVTALAVVPGGATVYLGSANGGVWKSTDSGVNWDPVFEEIPSIGAVELDPTDANVVYVGTGEANGAIDNYDGAGLFRSVNGGAGWSYLGLQETRRIARVAIDPSDPARIFVAAMGSQYSTNPDRGLYRSTNGGASWTKVLFLNDSTGVCDVVIHPNNPDTIYAASWERIRRPSYRRAHGPGCGIWRSVDGGDTWTRLQNGLPVPSDDVGRIGLAIAPSFPSRVFAQIIGGPGLGLNGLGVFRTDDNGNTWSRTDVAGFTTGFGGFGWYFGDIVVDPLNPDRVLCLGVSLMVSNDGGMNFAGATGNAHVDEHALWVDPSNTARWFMGSDGGFFWTTNSGALWSKSVDLPLTQFYAGTIDPSNAARLVGGTQDNNTVITSAGPSAWSAILGGDGFYCVVDPTNPQILIAEWQNCCGRTGPRRSTNGGSGWTQANPTVSAADRYNWNTPFVMDPNNHNVILVGSNRVWRSTDNGLSYSSISSDLTRNNPGQFTASYSTISTLEIAPANSNYYYVGTDDGRVWRSTTGGGGGPAWTEITAGLPIRWVTRVATDPANASIVYVTLSGYSQDEYVAHIYRSTNAGDNWTAIDGNLPDVPVNDIIVDPTNSNRLYVATDIGVYTTQDLGGTWYPAGVGLPISPVYDITLHAASRTLAAFTHGRSAWTLDLNDLPVAVGPASAAPRLALSAPAPNPARGDVRFRLDLPAGGQARVEVYDAFGRRVASLLDARLGAGSHLLAWSGRDPRGRPAPAGAYFVRAEIDGSARTSRRFVRIP